MWYRINKLYKATVIAAILIGVKFVFFVNSAKSDGIVKMVDKYNDIFLRKLDKFKLAAEFDMGDGTMLYTYERCAPADLQEIETYMNELEEEDRQFPDLYSEVINKYITEHKLN